MIYDLKRSVGLRWLIDPVLHSSFDDLVSTFCMCSKYQGLLGESNGADKLLWTPVSLLLGGQHVDVVSDQELSHLNICPQCQKMQENVSFLPRWQCRPRLEQKWLDQSLVPIFPLSTERKLWEDQVGNINIVQYEQKGNGI